MPDASEMTIKINADTSQVQEELDALIAKLRALQKEAEKAQEALDKLGEGRGEPVRLRPELPAWARMETK